MALQRWCRRLFVWFHGLPRPGCSCRRHRPQLECLEGRDLLTLFTPLPPLLHSLGSASSPALGRGANDSGALLAVDQPGNSGLGMSGDVVQLFRSDATGQFHPAGTIPFPATGGFSGSLLAVGDFNGDGYADLAVGHLTATTTGDVNTLLVYLGGPSGLQIQPAETLSLDNLVPLVGGIRPGVQLSAITAGNLDGNANADLALTFVQPGFGLVPGLPTAYGVATFRGSSSGAPLHIASEDLPGNYPAPTPHLGPGGFPLPGFATDPFAVAILPGTGLLALTDAQTLFVFDTVNHKVLQAIDLTYGTNGSAFPLPLTEGDFTGSGRPALLVEGVDGKFHVFLNNGTNSFSEDTAAPFGPRGLNDTVYTAPPAADFTGSGRADVAILQGDPTSNQPFSFDVLLGQTDGTWTQPDPPYGPLLSGFIASLTTLLTADVNGDGRPDLVVVDTQAIRVFLNTTPGLPTTGGTSGPTATFAVDVLGPALRILTAGAPLPLATGGLAFESQSATVVVSFPTPGGLLPNGLAALLLVGGGGDPVRENEETLVVAVDPELDIQPAVRPPIKPIKTVAALLEADDHVGLAVAILGRKPATSIAAATDVSGADQHGGPSPLQPVNADAGPPGQAPEMVPPAEDRTPWPGVLILTVAGVAAGAVGGLVWWRRRAV